MTLDQCAAYLREKHLGAAKAIKSPHLAHAFSVSNRELREIVNILRRGGIPVASNSDGYYYAANTQEIRATIAHMRRRISGITAAIRGLERCCEHSAHLDQRGGDST